MSEPPQVDTPQPGAPTQSPAPNKAELSAEDSFGAENSATAGEDINPARTRPKIPDGIPNIENMHAQRKKLYTETEKTEAWTSVTNTVERYSDKMIERWMKEIDTYLVFAGLFSAILTAFNVPAYALLNPTPPDPSIALLQQISSKLDSFSINPPFLNSTRPSNTNRPNVDTALPIPRWAVWLNGLWFSGLILSLTSASIGLMVKQWLNEYSSGTSETSRHAARVRQYRLENLKAWHVEAVVNTIPILLQLSLVCFLAGLLIFLWNLHSTVAAFASTLVGFLAIFTTATTLLPLWKPRCAYLSPQARTFYRIWQPKRFAYRVCAPLATFCFGATGDPHGTVGYESPSSKSRIQSYFNSWKDPKQTWQGRERSRIDELKCDLDMKTLSKAYRITLHPDTLSAATVCLMDFDTNDIVDYFRLLHKSAQEHFGPEADGSLGIWGHQKMLWLYVILCVSLTPHNLPLLDACEAAALGVYFDSGSWSSSMQTAEAEWAASTLNALTDFLEGEGTGGRLTESVDRGRLLMEREKLIGIATDRKKPLTNVVLRVISGTYRQVRLEQEHLTKASSGDAKAALTRCLQSVYHFLECANHASTSSLPANSDLEIVRAYTRDVLTELTHALLELFTKGQGAAIESKYLEDVLRKLRDFNDTRVEECIPDELVPEISHLVEKLTRAKNYDEYRRGKDIQLSARTIKANITHVKCGKPAVTWAYYHQVLLQHKHLTGTQLTSSEEARAAHTSYLESVHHFLEYVSCASTLSLPADDLETVRAYTRNVLTKLTHTLLELFAKDRVEITIEPEYLWDVMQRLRGLDDTYVGECITDNLVPEILHLTEQLTMALHYSDCGRFVTEIRDSARIFKTIVVRVKSKPGTTSPLWKFMKLCEY